jgi:hypothetical protein
MYLRLLFVMLGSPQEQKPAPQESLIACFPSGKKERPGDSL